MHPRTGIFGLTLASALALSAIPARAGYIYYGPAAPLQDTWTGAYAGLNGGWAWIPNSGGPAFSNVGAGSGSNEGGYIVGGQAGYNWQGGVFGLGDCILLGVEGDLQGSGISASGTDQSGDSFRSSLDWYGSLRGRVGFAYVPVLFYFTGGLAFGGIHNSITTPTAAFNFDSTAVGYTIGGGGEYKFTPVWSFKIEYQYLNFGTNEPTNGAGAGFQPASGSVTARDNDYSIIRFGVNYRFW